MPDFDEITLAKLARERAMNIKNVYVLFAQYGITEEQYDDLAANNQYFRRLLEQYTLDWQATTTTADRVKIGSLAYLEQILPKAAKMALNEEDPQPLASITSLGTLLAKTAGIGDAKNAINPAERFVITINLGDGDVKTYDKSIDLEPSTKEISNGQAHNGTAKEDPFDILWTTGKGGGAEREGSW